MACYRDSFTSFIYIYIPPSTLVKIIFLLDGNHELSAFRQYTEKNKQSTYVDTRENKYVFYTKRCINRKSISEVLTVLLF
jgi:hypothetical protein